MADALDLKSNVPEGTCGFKSRPAHGYLIARAVLGKRGVRKCKAILGSNIAPDD